ncbi:MAG: hypothetical protein QOI73_867 [Solirubrobacteraceae bacterium]|nr:hypothetical protein [Solirubrobacteraceae bacterium]
MNPVSPFDPDPLIALPSAVSEASDAYRAALARVNAVRADAAAASEEVSGARAVDEAAARDAVAAGKVPPAPTTSKAAEAAERAARAVPAAIQLAEEAQREFLTACAENFPALIAALEERQRSVREQGEEALAVLGAAIRDTADLAELAAELNLASVQARRSMFQPARRPRRKDLAAAPLAPARAALGDRPAGNRFVTGQAA